MRRSVLITLGVVVVLAVVGAVAWFGPWRGGDDDADRSARRPGVDVDDPAATVADAFADAWSADDLSTVAFTEASGNVADRNALVTASLVPGDEDPPVVEVTEVRRAEGSTTRAIATASVTWQLDPERRWTYDTRFAVVEDADGWKVDWTPAVVAPGLRADELLRTVRTTAARGRIVDDTGQPLVAEAGSVVVGIRRSRTPDAAATALRAAEITGVDAADLLARVEAAGPEDFVDVVTLPRADYDRIRPEIQPLPGTVFRTESAATGLPQGYARAVLGSTGTATPEIVAASEGAVVEGDITGLSGLQLSQNELLSGTPGLTVEAVSPAEGATPRALKAFPATAGDDLVVTLDQRVQTLADEIVAEAAQPTALVAIRVSNGDVLAVSNGPSSSGAYNRAMFGKYPPGSVFKVPTALALLDNGLTPDTVVDCPAELTVGKVFRNAGGSALGPVDFRTNFARSCNTAFVSMVEEVTSDELTETAALLGYRDLDIGLPVFTASVPEAVDRTEHAAQMIGQGRVEASAFSVALSSASVANGSSLNPRLIVDPAVTDTGPGEALPPEAVLVLRDLMRSVVTDGTGSVLADVRGGEVFAKTGTAEFGTDDPPRTHAWITGFQGDVAFAVLVDDGGGGGAVAGPVAARFLDGLAQR